MSLGEGGEDLLRGLLDLFGDVEDTGEQVRVVYT